VIALTHLPKVLAQVQDVELVVVVVVPIKSAISAPRSDTLPETAQSKVMVAAKVVVMVAVKVVDLVETKVVVVMAVALVNEAKLATHAVVMAT